MLNGESPHGLYPDEVFPAVDSYADLATADLNHDGALDIVTAGGGTGGSTIAVSLGRGDGTFSPLTKYPVGSAPEALAIGDLNGDTHPDVVVANYLSRSISVLLGAGDGTLRAHAAYATGGKPRSLAIADLDRDGAADVVLASVEASSGSYYRLSVFRGLGGGALGTPTDYALLRSPTGLAAADVNGDLYPDIVLTQYLDYDNSALAVLLNRSDGTLDAAAETIVPGWLSAVAVGDLDADGDADLVLGNVKDQTLGVRHFVGPPPPRRREPRSGDDVRRPAWEPAIGRLERRRTARHRDAMEPGRLGAAQPRRRYVCREGRLYDDRGVCSGAAGRLQRRRRAGHGGGAQVRRGARAVPWAG